MIYVSKTWFGHLCIIVQHWFGKKSTCGSIAMKLFIWLFHPTSWCSHLFMICGPSIFSRNASSSTETNWLHVLFNLFVILFSLCLRDCSKFFPNCSSRWPPCCLSCCSILHTFFEPRLGMIFSLSFINSWNTTSSNINDCCKSTQSVQSHRHKKRNSFYIICLTFLRHSPPTHRAERVEHLAFLPNFLSS